MHRMFVRLEKRHDSVRRAFNPNSENRALAPVLHECVAAFSQHKGTLNVAHVSRRLLHLYRNVECTGAQQVRTVHLGRYHHEH
jgi:hypothetical protein